MKTPLYYTMLLALVLLLSGCNWQQDTAASLISGDCRVNSVHDGDTLRLTCQGEKIKVRLYCIDTPEIGQRPWGSESGEALRRMTPSQVRLVTHTKDRYGRMVSEVFSGDDNLNLAMVRQGHAAVYPKYCDRQAYFEAEAQARQQGLGIWSKPGLHQQPWQWRHRQRQ